VQFLPPLRPVVRPSKERSAGAHLPYLRHVDARTIETRDGQLLQIIKLRGLLFETADTDELNYRKRLRDATLQAIGSPRFAFYHHVVRRQVAPSVAGEFPDPFSAALDEKWSSRLDARKLFINDIYITLIARPDEKGGRLAGFLSGARGRTSTASLLRQLDIARETLVAALDAYGPELLVLEQRGDILYSQQLEFLAALLSGEERQIRAPAQDLGEHISYRRISFGQEAIELAPGLGGERGFAGLVSIKDYPEHTEAGMFDELLRLPFELVVTQSFGFVARRPTLSRMNLALRRMRSTEDEAVSLRDELSVAKDDVAAGRALFGEHHLSVMVRGAAPEIIDTSVAEIQAVLADTGVVAVREDVALEPTFWAQFPGNFPYITRRALISSANFAGFASFHNFATGQPSGNHWGDAIALLETTAAGPYFFNFHQGDLGNFTIIGPSGSGKTVVLNFLLAQARRLDPRIVFFDKDRGADPFIRAIGGRYEVLSPGEPSGFNPLLLPDTADNRRFIIELLSLLAGGTNADEAADLVDAVDANYGQPPEVRRLRYLVELLRGSRRPTSDDLWSRLADWWGDGRHAWLFDNEEDHTALDERVVGFDMTRILDEPALRTPAMMYLFHRVEERLDGDPTIIVVDEGWKALDDPVFVRRIKDWEKTIRKKNGIVGFATQSAQDALDSQIASAIIEQSATQIFMANPKARAEDYIGGFGLTPHEFGIVRALSDNAHAFLIKHGNDSVVARLNLRHERDILTVLSGREKTVRILDELRGELGDDPADWLQPLLERV
jgi:type IV secretion system protein VirB4